MLKFSTGGKASAAEMHQDDLGLLDPDGGDGQGEGYLVQAGCEGGQQVDNRSAGGICLHVLASIQSESAGYMRDAILVSVFVNCVPNSVRSMIYSIRLE